MNNNSCRGNGEVARKSDDVSVGKMFVVKPDFFKNLNFRLRVEAFPEYVNGCPECKKVWDEIFDEVIGMFEKARSSPPKVP